MVTARFEYLEEAGALVMEVRGHAGFAQLGKDPVCAGASVLAMTVAQCAAVMDGKLQKKANVLIRNGRIGVILKPKPEYFPEALHLMYVGQTGMRLLAEAYPEHVQVRTFETDFDECGLRTEPDSIKESPA